MSNYFFDKDENFKKIVIGEWFTHSLTPRIIKTLGVGLVE
jgi:hypothetical protein